MQNPTGSRRLPLIVFALLLTGSGVGCGRSLSTVSGRVSLQDQPVAEGSVVLYCEDQQIVRGLIGPDGAYSIPNVPRGDVRVTVVPPVRMPDGFGKKYETPPVIDGPIIPAASPDKRGPLAIPPRYGIPEESGLSLKVVRDSIEFDIRLTR